MEIVYCHVSGTTCKFSKIAMKIQIIHRILDAAMNYHLESSIELMSRSSIWQGKAISVSKKSRFSKLFIDKLFTV